jgi:hypothetical protein
MLGLLAVVIAALIAAASSALFVLPAIFIGYPLLLLVLCTLYLHACARIGAPCSGREGNS